MEVVDLGVFTDQVLQVWHTNLLALIVCLAGTRLPVVDSSPVRGESVEQAWLVNAHTLREELDGVNALCIVGVNGESRDLAIHLQLVSVRVKIVESVTIETLKNLDSALD